MALGVGDYFEKTVRLQAGLASRCRGGRDSLLCLLIAHRYSDPLPGLLSPPSSGRGAAARCCAPSTCRARYSSAQSRKAAEVGGGRAGGAAGRGLD